jgi:hypothetical protein
MAIRFDDPSIARLKGNELTGDLILPIEGHPDGETHNTALGDILQFVDATGTAESISAAAIATHTLATDPHPQYATDDALSGALIAHAAAPNPHPQYATDTELSGAIAAHNSATDPHPQYATDTALSGAITAHTSATDPHPQYATDTALSGAITAHTSATDPHPQYATDTDLSGAITTHTSASNPHPQYTTQNLANLTDAAAARTRLELGSAAQRASGDFEAIGTVNAALSSHLVSTDPHPQYASEAKINAAITTHVSVADPHPQYTTDAEVNTAIGTHAAAANPHPQYQNSTQVNTAIATHASASDAHPQYQTSTQVNTAIATHASAADPHSQYTTETEVNTIVGAHTAAANPHSQYQTSAQVNTAIGTHAAAADPHPQYTTETEVNTIVGAHTAAANPHPQYQTSTQVNTAIGTHSALQGNSNHIPANGITDAQVASISAPKIAVAADSANNLAAGTLQATLASQSQSIFQLNQVQIRNQFPQLIANGRFWINQRSGASYNVGAGNAGVTLDGWRITNGCTAAALSISASATVPSIAQAGYMGASLSIRVTAAQADPIAADQFMMAHCSILGYNFQLIAQRRFTVSFWVNSPVAGVYCFAARSGDFSQNFVAEYTINAANTWEFKEVVIEPTPVGGTWNYTNGAGIRLSWTLVCGSNFQTAPGAWVSSSKIATNKQVNFAATVGNEFLLSNVQLQAGYPTVVPTRDQDLWFNCYPFYQRLSVSAYSYISSGTNIAIADYTTIGMPMRTTPTATLVTAGNRQNLSDANPPLLTVSGRQARYLIYAATTGYAHAVNELWELSSEL